jgi:hypothetical protein
MVLRRDQWLPLDQTVMMEVSGDMPFSSQYRLLSQSGVVVR